MNATTCVHCNVTLTAADVDSGWCDSCGKRLPGGAKAPAKHQIAADESEPAPAAGKKAAWAWGGAVLALLAVAVASVVAFAR